MASGALKPTSGRMPDAPAVTAGSTARAATREEQARVSSLMQAAGRAHQAGNLPRLEELLREVLEIDPQHASALYNLGIACRDRGDAFAAEGFFRQAIRHDPELVDAYQGLADVLFGAKHLLPAASLYEHALTKAPNRLPLLQNLAKTRLLMKDAPEAERLARRILSIEEESAEAWSTLAWALLFRKGDTTEALHAADRALAIDPANARHATAMREVALRRLDRLAEADALWSALLSQAMASQESARAITEGYYWLSLMDRCRAVTEAFVTANPDQIEGLKDLASLMMADGEFAMAQSILERAAAVAPDHYASRLVRGLNGFRMGEFDLGLELYEARWHRSPLDKRWEIPVPEWDGQPVDGHLIVYCEQGVGDYVMFALLFQELRRHAKSITIEVNVRVGSLFRRTFPDMKVVDRHSLPPGFDASQYQAKVAMGDLPRLLRADMENLPNRQGFLIPEPNLTTMLRNRYRAMFPGKRLVGISWRSGNRDSATIRSIDLSLWKPIFETPDCAFISLQYGDNTRDLEILKSQTGHEVYWDRQIDPLQFLDPLTAQIAAMDLIISVDNSTVHFAGAVGTPCWVFLPLNSDWRWLLKRTSSIWYDSLYLLRQQAGEGWEQVVARAAQKLREIGTEALTDAQAEVCLRCGEELLRRESFAQAETYFRWLLETGRHKPAAFHGIGKAAQIARHPQDAAALLMKAAEMAPDRIDYKADCAVALFEAGHHDMGEKLARELTRVSNDPTALMAMGHILAAKGLLDQSTDYFARVLRTDPKHIIARTVLAGLQALQGEDDLAAANFGRVVQQAPDLPGTRTALAEIDLRHERDEKAAPNFAWRFGDAPEELPRHLAMMAPDDRPKPLGDGKVRRRRLFLRAERNAVEQLIFARRLPAVAEDSRRLLIECEPSTLGLLQGAFPDIRCMAAGGFSAADLNAEKIQIAANLGSLASYAGSSDAWLPCDQKAAATRRAELSDGEGAVLIGLAWRTQPSPLAGLERFQSLFTLPGIRWLALPIGAVTPDAMRFLSSGQSGILFQPGRLQAGLGSLAAEIAALDLVVGTDDLCATVAGALGKPVWKIAGVADHWSWLAEGSTSKWHPTARIFRAAPDEGRMMADLHTALAQFAGMK